MQTNFTAEQLENPDVARSNQILRSCVHCGFCTATCPTYKLLGDELDSPRGRIYLIKDMLENNRIPDAKTVQHIDRCLSCLSCMTTCPSGVHYMHLIDHARAYIEQNYKRTLSDRFLRWALAKILPYPNRFRLALIGAKIIRPFMRLIPDRRIKTMIKLAPANIPAPSRNDAPQVFSAKSVSKLRVILMTGCAQKALNTDINDATIRILRRLGCDVIITKGQGCCGALTHHMGKTCDAHTSAKANIKAWTNEFEQGGIDAIVINTSGCGTTIKDYAHMFRDTEFAQNAARISQLAMDITELLAKLDMPSYPKKNTKVAYHAACSLQHGQNVKNLPKSLLERVGFDVVEPHDAHLCCGSAGTYNLLQPLISEELRDNKVKSLRECSPDVIAAGNIGCMMQIGSGSEIPIVHTVELLDWATGGPRPTALQKK